MSRDCKDSAPASYAESLLKLYSGNPNASWDFREIERILSKKVLVYLNPSRFRNIRQKSYCAKVNALIFAEGTISSLEGISEFVFCFVENKSHFPIHRRNEIMLFSTEHLHPIQVVVYQQD